jgi:heptosyltransferase-1
MLRGTPNRILIVKLSSIGDVIHSLPVAAALRRRYPRAYLAWAVGPAAAEAVTGNPHLDETLIMGGGADAAGVCALPPLSAPGALRRALRARRFDTTVDMQGLFKSALLAFLSGARDRIGFRNLQEGTFLLNNRRVVPDRRDVHAVEGYFGFARALDAPVEPVDFTIATSAREEAEAAALLSGIEHPIALIPGARWLSKRWPPGHFAAAADALAEESGGRGVIVGAADDAPLAAAIAAAARTPLVDLTGRTTLKQCAAVLRRCRLVIGNDTGPMYLAAAVGTPTVAVFGPTDASRLGPYGEGHARVWAHLTCAPCRRRECAPLRCLEAVTPEQVVAAARELLRRKGAGHAV